ncbi:hypothetical protein DSECCO2_244380 [anaerobic digester metagenome]
MKFRGLSSLLIIPAIFLAILPGAITGQVHVVPFGKGMPSVEKNGIFYSLPRNVIKVQLAVSKTETFKGPYADFAAKYLGLSSFISKNSVEYSIVDVSIEVLAETDPGQYYFIELDEKAKSGRSLLFALNEQGFISGYSDASNIKGRRQLTADGKPLASGTVSPFIDLLQPKILEKVDTIIRRISVDTSTFEDIFIKRSISERSTEQLAKEAAELIRKIDDNKFNLITGYQEVNYSKDALEFMISQLEKTKQEYLALFRGVSRTAVTKHVFYVTPGNNPEGMLETICGFSGSEGITARNTPGAESVSLLIESMNQISSIREFITQREAPSKVKRGLYYRIPEKARISLKSGNRVLDQKEAMISQLGTVTFLPAGIFSYIKMNPLTGGIELISSE